jgi:TRAP-type C4-dicarboxylate transport system substrate-binding protein
MQPIHQVRKILAVLLATLLLPTAVSATQTLVYTDHEPLGGMRTRFIQEVFFPAIEKESQGRLKIEAHWDSKLATGYDALSVVGKPGTADMAIVVPEYSAKTLPLHQIFKSFPTGPTGDQQVAFFRHVYAEIPAFPAELAKQNAVNLLFSTGYPVAFFSTKPLDRLEDIKGQKWRSASFWHQDFLRNAGATPVSMPWGDEIYQAMRAGKLDGLMVNVDGGYQLNVHKVAPNVLYSEKLWMGHVYLLVMNKDTWDKLAQQDKQAIERAAATAYQTLGTVMNASFDAQVAELKKDGISIRTLQPKELEQWQAATRYREVQAAWVKEQEGKGLKEAGPVLQQIGEMVNDAMQ